MIAYLYATADAVGVQTGGGAVTQHESLAMAALGEMTVFSYPEAPRPWGADESLSAWLREHTEESPRLAHFYAGTFTESVRILKERGCRVTYTCAAHDIRISQKEHAKLGLSFDYSHLAEPELWARYVAGYLEADVVICPSQLSAEIVQGYGCRRVVVIPHGVDLSARRVKPPSRFVVGNLGQCGADKGVRYLLQAWKRLDYQDALLVLAGWRTEALLDLVRREGGGNVYLRGAVERPSEVYESCSLYVQPSATEGFGIEVLEAMAHGRPVLCSDAAGASECVPRWAVFIARSAEILATAIWTYRMSRWGEDTDDYRLLASAYAWPVIREKYIRLWRSL